MVPLDEYAVVSQDADLHTAIATLHKARENFVRFKGLHRAILVQDQEGRVIGKLSMFNILLALEPKYRRIEKLDSLSSRHGLSMEFLKSMSQENSLWEEPVSYMCNRAKELIVKDIMEVPDEGYYIDENASLAEAIHQMVVPRQQSLLVVKDKTVIGVLRLTDVFNQLCGFITE